MEPVADHPVPAGPLAVRWRALALPDFQAGSLAHVRLTLENAGLARWRAGIGIAYHWLDERGNPIVWDGIRTPVELDRGTAAELRIPVRAPIPPGRYRLALDLVAERRFWFAELGNHAPEREVDVRPRDGSDARDTIVDEVEPAPDRNARIRAAHEEGFAAVGGSVAVETGRFRRPPAELEPYVPGGGRNPVFAFPLVCPSLLPPLEPNAEVAGLPAWRPEGDEPWLYDARVAVTLRSRSGRRRA